VRERIGARARRIKRRAHVGLLLLLLLLLLHGRVFACEPLRLRLRRGSWQGVLLLALDCAAHVEEVAIHDLAVKARNGSIHDRAVLEFTECKVPATEAPGARHNTQCCGSVLRVEVSSSAP
jgi:hypothetical protein